MASVEFGLGLIGIGKPWGFAHPEVPPESQARALLDRAFSLGVRYFDTAPSYGYSEERLGRFLAGLTPVERASLRIATKFGEHWDAGRQEPFVDHSYDALVRSLDGSLERLRRVDFLQLHKTTPAALKDDAVARAFEYALSLGIAAIGASVSDVESACLAVANPSYGVLQLPYHVGQQTFAPAIEAAAARDMHIAVNRPFGMGRMLYDAEPVSKTSAFAFILRKPFRGVVLSGTKSPEHLAENWHAFRQAEAQRAGL
jgi:aryl-alcohol dehydrogenase-like predicted oxidoreductase